MNTPTANTPSRRSFVAGAAGLTALALGTSGCSAITGEGGGGTGADAAASGDITLPTVIDDFSPAIEPYYTAESEAMADVYVGNPTEFPKSVDRDPHDGSETITTFQLMWGTPPLDREKNEYWQELEKRLGVTYEPQFVPQATYDSKFSTMLASGKIPDLVFLNDQSAVELQAVRDGAFADLSEILGGDEITKWPNLANRTEAIWQASLKKGRVFQIPAVVARITNHAVMNRSVLEETSVGTEPRDADELMTALLEASKQKIGGQKVYGFTNVDVNRPLFYRLFRVGAEWQRDDSGKLVHMIETENYQEMLTWLAAAWKDGAFDPNSLQPQTETTAWRSALSYEAISGSFGGSLFADAEDQHETTLDFFTLPGFDGGDPLIIQNIPYGRSTSISAEAAKDPDRLQVVLDTLDYLSAPWGSEESLFIGSGIEGRHYEFGELNFPISTDEHTDELGVQYVGVESGRTRYSAHPEAVDLADSFVESMKRTADHSEVRILEGLESDSETFISKGPQLKESFTDFENGVITGRESVDDLESFVSDWLSQGGESIRGEYEALLKEAGR